MHAIPTRTKKKATKKTNARLEREFLRIAKECFFVETLEERKRDSLDFHNVSVWGISKAMEQAYNLGKADAMKQIERDSK